MVVAHIFGLPVEESIGSIAPLVGVGGAVLAIRVSALRRRFRRRSMTGAARAKSRASCALVAHAGTKGGVLETVVETLVPPLTIGATGRDWLAE